MSTHITLSEALEHMQQLCDAGKEQTEAFQKAQDTYLSLLFSEQVDRREVHKAIRYLLHLKDVTRLDTARMVFQLQQVLHGKPVQ